MHFLSCLRMTSDLNFFHRCTSLPGCDKAVQKPNDYSAKKVLCLHLQNIANGLHLAGLSFSSLIFPYSKIRAVHTARRVSCKHLPWSAPQEAGLKIASIQKLHVFLNVSVTSIPASQMSCTKGVTHTARKLHLRLKFTTSSSSHCTLLHICPLNWDDWTAK